MPSTIVLVNDRPEGELALRWAADHARSSGTDVQVVLVRADSPAAPEYGSPALRERVRARLSEAGLPHLLHDPEEDVVGQVDRLGTALAADLVAVPGRRPGRRPGPAPLAHDEAGPRQQRPGAHPRRPLPRRRGQEPPLRTTPR